MIGFNVDGEVRCWVNNNFASNRVENAEQSIIGSGDGEFSRNIDKLDQKLRESI